jgi:hypothetical protein
MNNDAWDEIDFLDESEEQQIFEKSTKNKGKSRKRKWREIEQIKEQRRLKRDLADFEREAF